MAATTTQRCAEDERFVERLTGAAALSLSVCPVRFGCSGYYRAPGLQVHAACRRCTAALRRSSLSPVTMDERLTHRACVRTGLSCRTIHGNCVGISSVAGDVKTRPPLRGGIGPPRRNLIGRMSLWVGGCTRSLISPTNRSIAREATGTARAPGRDSAPQFTSCRQRTGGSARRRMPRVVSRGLRWCATLNLTYIGVLPARVRVPCVTAKVALRGLLPCMN
jgi:hypothetical protein